MNGGTTPSETAGLSEFMPRGIWRRIIGLLGVGYGMNNPFWGSAIKQIEALKPCV